MDIKCIRLLHKLYPSNPIYVMALPQNLRKKRILGTCGLKQTIGICVATHNVHILTYNPMSITSLYNC